jgi:hypothetical protein
VTSSVGETWNSLKTAHSNDRLDVDLDAGPWTVDRGPPDLHRVIPPSGLSVLQDSFARLGSGEHLPACCGFG